MPVLDRGYRRWRGTPTSYLQRVLVIPRFDVLEILSRKAWLMAYVVCLLPPLGLAVWVYFMTNLAVLRKYLPGLADVLASAFVPGPEQYQTFTWIQIGLASSFALLIGPPLVTRDFANAAMPLYLSKALRRLDYVAGRWAVLIASFSLATWLPLMLVFGLQVGMSTAAWREKNAWMALAILGTCLPLTVLLTALITAIGALVHRSNAARAALLGLFIITGTLGGWISEATGSVYGRVVSPLSMVTAVSEAAFEPPVDEETQPITREGLARSTAPPPATQVPAAIALCVIAAWIAGCVLVLSRRVRPVEVVG